MRFFFQVRDGSGQRDQLGKDLPDLATARIEVEQMAAIALIDRPEAVWRGGGWSIDVTDADGMLVFALHLFSSVSPRVQLLLRQSSGVNAQLSHEPRHEEALDRGFSANFAK